MKLGRRLVGLHKFLKPPVLLNSVLNVKTPVGAFNQEKALVVVGAFSMIVNSSYREPSFEALVSTLQMRQRLAWFSVDMEISRYLVLNCLHIIGQ